MKQTHKSQSGFTLAELLVALGVGLVVLTSAGVMLKKSFEVTFLLTQRAEMQQNARAGINSIMRDLSLVGSGGGLPVGGIQLPTGTGSSVSKFACSSSTACYVKNNTFGTNNYLYYAMPNPTTYYVPGNPNPPGILGVTSDSITLAYTDPRTNLGAFSAPPLPVSINASGSQVTIDSTLDISKLQLGDLIVLTSGSQAVIGSITSFAANNKINFASSDALNINQPSASNGNIASLKVNNAFPTNVIAYRLLLITYFVEQMPGPDGILGTDDDTIRLMKQVNLQTPVPVVENIENLQITYDVIDDSSGNPDSTLKTNNKTANGTPNLIKKINIALTVRSAQRSPKQSFQRITLSSSISPRDLSFRDRYQ